MKKNFFIISLTFILGLASCSFTTREFNESDRDKLLMQIISYVLDQGHFVKKDINDEFSKKVFSLSSLSIFNESVSCNSSIRS